MTIIITYSSFHVGSGCLEADAFSKAISVCRTVFREAEELGMNLELLDIGGGFPGHDAGDVSLKEISEQINCSLEKYFPQSSGVRVISEPGRQGFMRYISILIGHSVEIFS